MFSIIVPTYNEEKAIAQTLAQFQALTSVPYEIIVSDDASTDQTVDRAHGLANRVITNQSGTRGIAANRNRGAAAAQYPYLVFVDSGVRIADINQFFPTLQKEFEQHSHVGAITVRTQIEPSVATWADKLIFGAFDAWFRFANNVLGYGAATGKLQAVKRSVFEQVGGYNEKLVAGEDIELFTRISKSFQTRFEPRLTIFHEARRAHAYGWPRLFWIWTVNIFSVILRGKASAKEWEAVR